MANLGIAVGAIATITIVSGGQTVAEVLDAMGPHSANTLDEVVALDGDARRNAERLTAARAA